MSAFLTVQQAAERLQVHPTTLRRWIKTGAIPAARYGHLWRIPEEALTAPHTHYTPPEVRRPRPISGEMTRLARSVETR